MVSSCGEVYIEYRQLSVVEMDRGMTIDSSVMSLVESLGQAYCSILFVIPLLQILM